VKKRRAHTAETVVAQENRVRHGRTKVAKVNGAREAARQEARLDVLRREDGAGER
jgi:hypothetical protein